jgi:hypothetical protein
MRVILEGMDQSVYLVFAFTLAFPSFLPVVILFIRFIVFWSILHMLSALLELLNLGDMIFINLVAIVSHLV